MVGKAIIVVDGHQVISSLEESYVMKHTIWGNECASIRAGFQKKTSRTKKNGKEYESTNWYVAKPDGGLKSVGKEEPDYKKYYPPEPKQRISFHFREYEGHILLEEKDFNANHALFLNNLAFPLEECLNRIHPLYKNPQKAVDSVHGAGVSSERSSGNVGQKRTGNRDFDLPGECEIKGGGDCAFCVHDDCPNWESS